MGSKELGRLAGIAIFSLSFVAANAGIDLGSGQVMASDQPSAVTLSDAAVAAAQTDFSSVFNQMPTDGSAAIRVLHSVNGIEHLYWVAPVSTHEDAFLGRVTGTTSRAAYPATGDVIRFQVSAVRDWHIMSSDGTIFGNFAVRERLVDLPKQDALRLATLLTDEPRPQLDILASAQH